MQISIIAAIFTGYLLGSIPAAYIAGRITRGLDIREVGGGNMGTLNALRELGFWAGLVVLITDIAKGALSIIIAHNLGVAQVWVFAAGFAAVLGHNWPVFLRFRGGKGAAVAIGTLLALSPHESAICLAGMAIVIIFTSNLRLAIGVWLALLLLALWLFNAPLPFIIYTLAVSLFLLVRILPGFIKSLSGAHARKNLIIDRDYHFWQGKKR